ncbi:Putative heme-binding peroxidase [Vanrija pseudolonga]|uniref:Peroxidase n=1 Tax=Vanrija pseudolonga TaxID=143232 RepID=A0AAF1BRR9_9TREE|nr:Putative heme-binding peroxidase [Vanrija pseudolonga]
MSSVPKGDYDGIRAEVKKILKRPGYDDGSIGPVLVRLAWHASGTYSAKEKNGGSNGAGMRFAPESSDGANAGLEFAREFIDPIHAANPWISYADLWTLAGATAVEAMGGPKIPWKPGRTDFASEVAATEYRGNIDNRLPDAALGAQHIRDVFYRMGFNDQEIVALSGAHNLGRCHADRSGFDGPWVVNPIRFSNQYFKLLLTRKWVPRKWDGPFQYEAIVAGTRLMMLPTDIALIEDPVFRPWVEKYAADQALLFKDFAAAFGKLLELGVDRDGTGVAHLVKGGGCPFAAAAGAGAARPANHPPVAAKARL